MIGLYQFLTKVVLDDNTSPEIRKEALEFRDKLPTDETIEIEGVIYRKFVLDKCYMGTTNPIQFIKNLRNEYKITLKEAKQLSDHLRHNHNYNYKD